LVPNLSRQVFLFFKEEGLERAEPEGDESAGGETRKVEATREPLTALTGGQP
jgi:hypothetical protein